jgi:hypothetical protein
MFAALLLTGFITVRLHSIPAPADGFWSAVTAARDGRVYIGLCKHGGAGHLVQFDPASGKMRVIANMVEATHEEASGREPQAKIHTRMFEARDGKLYFATHLGNWWYHAREHDPGSYPGGHWLSYDPRTDRVEDLGILFPGLGGIITLIMEPRHNALYGMTFPRGYFVKFDPQARERKVLGRLANWHAIVRTLVADREGRVYGTVEPNRIFRYDPSADRLEFLPVTLPEREGLAPSPEGSTTTKRLWRTAILSRDGTRIYGIQAGSVDLFELDLATLKIRNLAQLAPDEFLDRPDVPYASLSLTEGADGLLYYFPQGGATRFDYYNTEGAASGGPRLHLVTYDPKTGRREDHGQLRGPNGEIVLGTEGATTASDGTIYLVGLVGVPGKTSIQLISYRPGVKP